MLSDEQFVRYQRQISLTEIGELGQAVVKKHAGQRNARQPMGMLGQIIQDLAVRPTRHHRIINRFCHLIFSFNLNG